MAVTGKELVTLSQAKIIKDWFTGQLDKKQDAATAFDGKYTSLTDVPAEFTPKRHTHEIADVIGLQAALDGRIKTVTIGKTTTGEPGTNASVANSGTATDIVLDFTIPRGADGAAGKDGVAGQAGPKGDTGATGADGKAATITVGKVTTLAAGSNATVTNSGTSNAAILDFGIPQGPKGAYGAGGSGGSTDEWHRYPFGVNETVTIGSKRTLVTSIAFKVGDKDTVCDVHAQTLLDITLPAPTVNNSTTTFTPIVLTCTWVLDGVEYTDFQPIETYATAGRHVLHLYLAPYATANMVHNLDLYMQCQDGSATIQNGWMMGMLEGNGLAGGTVWNGRFDIDETFQRINTNPEMPLPTALKDNVDTALIAPIPSNVSDTFSRLDLNTITLQPSSIKDTPSLHPGTEAIDWLHADIESYDKTQGEWVGNIFQASKQATLTSWLMGTDQTIAGITSITPVDAPDTAVYQLSWDGGTTWGAIDDHGTWTLDATMTGSRMAALDQAQYAAWYTPRTGLKARVTLQAGTTIRQILVTYKLTTEGFQS